MLAATTVLMTGCGSDSDSNSGGDNNGGEDGGSDVSYEAMSINAASYTDWVYVSLANGEVLTLDEATAATSTDWHIAFRRSNIKLNGGVSGSGAVKGAVADAQDDYYTDGAANASVFTNASADTEAAALDVEYDTSDVEYVTDTYATAFDNFYVYDSTTHQISANTDSGWLVRHADNATYSKVTISQLSYAGIDLEWVTQAADTQQFAGNALTLSETFADGDTLLCLDLDTQQSVDCDSAAADWDLQYEVNLDTRAIRMWTNGGVRGTGNGGVFGELEVATLADYTSATDVNGQDISSHYVADSSASVFSEHSWYAYNLNGEHKLWPNYRTYLVDLDSADETAAQYTLQVANYYSLGGSGSPEIRFQLLNQGE